jgi:hypothetical protein
MLCISLDFFIKKKNCVLCRPYGSGVLGQQTTGVRKDNKMVIVILEYEFTIVYKLGRTYVVIDVLSRFVDSSEPLGVPNYIIMLDYGCIIIFCRTYMDGRSKNLETS